MLLRDITWPKRLFALDISRGLASLAVVFWHWQHFFYNERIPSESSANEQKPLYGLFRMFYEAGYFGVEYFFILSGFIFFWLYQGSISTGQLSAWSFSIQRFSRLYPLHFATLITVTCLQWCFVSREGVSFVYQNNDAYHFSLHLLLANSWGAQASETFNGPAWSISVEVLLYIFFFVCMRLRLGGGMAFPLILSASVLALSHFVRGDAYNILKGLMLFFFGGFIFSLSRIVLMHRSSWIKRLIYAITVMSWIFVITNFYIINIAEFAKQLGLLGQVALRVFPSFILFPMTILSLVLLEVQYRPNLKPIAWIGDITYSTYLLHFPLQLLVALAISFGLLGEKISFNPVFLVIFFAVLIAISYITFHKFEKPMQQYLRRKLMSDSATNEARL